MASKPRETAQEKRDRLAADAAHQEKLRVEEARAVFMEYHEDSLWAANKLASGTAPLTPESVRFMRDELVARAVRKKRIAEIDAQIAKDKADGII